MILPLPLPAASLLAEAIGGLAVECLLQEVDTFPKPGLVSHVDAGAHRDMDAAMLRVSAVTLRPFFIALVEAGAAGADMDRLRAIGLEAEGVMLTATGGVNTHRGAIFGLGLLCAAAGLRRAYQVPSTLGSLVQARWGEQILDGVVPLRSHGANVLRRYGAGGARAEAAAGFPSIYAHGLPAYREGGRHRPRDHEAARVHACMALIAAVQDTNLLHRGGRAGLLFAQAAARSFLASGGVGVPDWRARARVLHQQFVARRLSPGGCADLLAMTLFVAGMEPL